MLTDHVSGCKGPMPLRRRTGVGSGLRNGFSENVHAVRSVSNLRGSLDELSENPMESLFLWSPTTVKIVLWSGVIHVH